MSKRSKKRRQGSVDLISQRKSNLVYPLNFGVTARWVTLGQRVSQKNLMPLFKLKLISIRLSVISFEFWCDCGRQVTLGRLADLKSNGIIEISGPNNPKIDIHNDISVISFTF